MECAALDRLDGIMQRVVRGQNDHLNVGQFCLDPIEHFQTMRVGELQIEQHKRWQIRFEQLDALRSSPGSVHVITMPVQ